MESRDHEMLEWENKLKAEQPASSKISKIGTAIAGLVIVSIPGSLIVLLIHWLFTRFW